MSSRSGRGSRRIIPTADHAIVSMEDYVNANTNRMTRNSRPQQPRRTHSNRRLRINQPTNVQPRNWSLPSIRFPSINVRDMMRSVYPFRSQRHQVERVNNFIGGPRPSIHFVMTGRLDRNEVWDDTLHKENFWDEQTQDYELLNIIFRNQDYANRAFYYDEDEFIDLGIDEDLVNTIFSRQEYELQEQERREQERQRARAQDIQRARELDESWPRIKPPPPGYNDNEVDESDEFYDDKDGCSICKYRMVEPNCIKCEREHKMHYSCYIRWAKYIPPNMPVTCPVCRSNGEFNYCTPSIGGIRKRKRPCTRKRKYKRNVYKKDPKHRRGSISIFRSNAEKYL